MSTAPAVRDLLAAEKDAQNLMAEVQAYRAQRLRDAEMEAKTEAEQLRAKKEQELKTRTEKNKIDIEEHKAKAQKQTAAEVEKVEKLGESEKGQEVVKTILAAVLADGE